LVDWSFDVIDARERFSYWQEVVCQTVPNVSTESPSGSFPARICGRRFRCLKFASFNRAGHEIVRTLRHVARVPEHHCVITLRRPGRSHFSQGDETLSLEPNEIAHRPVNRIGNLLASAVAIRSLAAMREIESITITSATVVTNASARMSALHGREP